MKRYRIYITVILLVLSGAYYKGYSQVLNSSIVSIQMTYPIDNTIFDPATDSIIIQIQLTDYFIWEDNPPDSIGFFSETNNYSWVNVPVTHTTSFQPFYKSVSPVYDFTDDTNTICFWLYDLNNNMDTVICFDIIYNKPHVELVSVDDADMVTESDHYVINESNPTLNIEAYQSFLSLNQYSFIKKIDLKEVGFVYVNTLWQDEEGVQSIIVARDLPPEFSLSPGTTKSFTLMATGKMQPGHTGPADISEEFTFTLTYLDLDMPDTICQVNSYISLTGSPPGGIFEGNGILDSTNMFNPSLAQANAFNTITYKYLIDGQEFFVAKDIYIIELPLINLDGEFEVCANSTDVKYTILNAETSKYNYKWDFTGVAEILDSSDISRTVRWQSAPASFTGKISISLEGKNETQCPASYDYLVDIDPDDAPDKPCICYGDISRRLLLCSNTNASYYKWYIDETDSIWFSETPYFYLTDDIVKYNAIDESTIFTVRIANQLTGCYTTGYMCEEEMCAGVEQSNLLNKNAKEELIITILTNPVQNDLCLKSSGIYSGSFDLEIFTMNGTLITSNQLMKVLPVEDHIIDLNAELKPGFYLVICHYGNSRTSPVKMIIY